MDKGEASQTQREVRAEAALLHVQGGLRVLYRGYVGVLYRGPPVAEAFKIWVFGFGASRCRIGFGVWRMESAGFS